MTSFPQPSSSLLEDAETALDCITREEIALIKETEELLKQQVDYMIQIDDLRSYIPNLVNIGDDINKLSALTESSFALVSEVCAKFRRIDSTKACLEGTLRKIGDILDLETCSDGVMEALRSGNYEEAAVHIKRFLSIDQQELRKTVSILCDDHKLAKNINPATTSDASRIQINPETMNLALRKLDDARSELSKLCHQKILRAINEKNTRDIERFFKLFPLLNEHETGLRVFSDHLGATMIDSQLNQTLSAKDINQASKLTALFERVAKLIDSHQPMIETFYGPGHLISVARIFQKECDRLSRKVLGEFRNESNLKQVVMIVRSSAHLPIITQATQGVGNINLNASPKLDPKVVDKILNEIALIVSRSEVYLDFLTKRIQEDNETNSDDPMVRKSRNLELYNLVHIECELNHLVQEVGGIYVMLEQYYLNESSKKAILMDQIDMDPSFGTCFISSMLDDIFFIIKKCIKRAVSTKSNEVFCAIINHCVALLESTFCQISEERLRGQQFSMQLTGKNLDFSQAYNAIQSGRYLQTTTDQRKSNGQYYSALNNLDKACDYIKTLRVILDSDIKKLKPSILVTQAKHDNQLEKSVTCLNEFTRLTDKFTSIINSTLYQMFNSTLQTRLKAELKVALDDNPEFTRSTADPSELTYLTRCLLKTCDPSIEDCLFPDNYARLVSIAKNMVTSTMNLNKVR